MAVTRRQAAAVAEATTPSPKEVAPAIQQKSKAARAPADTPPFTLGTLRRAIPAHCFERSMTRSFAYLAMDVAVCAALWWGSTFIDSAPKPLPFLLWPLYWFFQGAFGTGIWVVAHGEIRVAKVMGIERWPRKWGRGGPWLHADKGDRTFVRVSPAYVLLALEPATGPPELRN